MLFLSLLPESTSPNVLAGPSRRTEPERLTGTSAEPTVNASGTGVPRTPVSSSITLMVSDVPSVMPLTITPTTMASSSAIAPGYEVPLPVRAREAVRGVRGLTRSKGTWDMFNDAPHIRQIEGNQETAKSAYRCW